LSVVVDPEYLPTAGGNTKIWRDIREGCGNVGRERRETGGYRIEGGGLRLKTDANHVERSDCMVSC
jgi:hypothetical protein